MRRTIQTAQIGLAWLIARGVPLRLDADWQENSTAGCDTGSAISALSEQYPTLDFSTVDPKFPSKSGRWAFSEQAIRQRGSECLSWLRDRPEKVVAVVSHSAFLRIGIHPEKWANADYRIFDFTGDVGTDIVEWKTTEENGGGMGKSAKGFVYAIDSDFQTTKPKKHKVDPTAEGEASVDAKAPP